MIFWSGHGILIPIFAILGMGLGTVLLGALGVPGRVVFPLAIWAGAGAVFLYAKTIGKTIVTPMIDPRTNREVLLKKRHTLFFIPAFPWAIIGFAFAGFITVTSIFVSPLPNSDMTSRASGEAEFSEANRKITTKGADGVIFYGNTAEAKELARNFSAMLTNFRGMGIEEGKKGRVSLSGNQFLTYCQLSGGRCVFMVHVPELRHFAKDAKEFIRTSAWAAAQLAVAELESPPSELAVGVRGALLYDSVWIGEVTSRSGNDVEAGVRSRHSRSGDRELLYRYFTDPEEENVEAVVMVAGAENGQTAEGPAMESEENRVDVVKPEVDSTPDEGLRTEIAKPTSNDDSGLGQVSSTKGSATPEEADLQKPMKAVADDAGVAATVESASEPMPAGTGAGDVPAGQEAKPVLPTEIRDWVGADGRTMNGSLQRFLNAEGTEAEFARADGKVFPITLDRFSAETQAEIRKLFDQSRAE